MRFGAAFWLQRTTWPEVRSAALAAEAAGFDSLWVDDHLLSDEGAWDDPKLEGWTTLAAIAAATTRPTVGLLVGANTLRNPGVTAKMAATVDSISGGRAILGLGGGWFEREHKAFGIEFGAGPGERLDRLAEAVPLLRRLLDGERVSHDGTFYRLRDAVCRPRPVQPRLPLLIGGAGVRKTIPLVARHADMWNLYGGPERLAEKDAILRSACAAIGRDPATIERSVTQNVVIRESVEAAAAEWRVVRDLHGPQAGEDEADLLGPPALVADGVRRYSAIGFGHLVWVFRAPFDLETIGRLGEVRANL